MFFLMNKFFNCRVFGSLINWFQFYNGFCDYGQRLHLNFRINLRSHRYAELYLYIQPIKRWVTTRVCEGENF